MPKWLAASIAGSRREAGFTLIELVVATLVLLLGVVLACDLLDESGRVLHHSVRRARDPWTLLGAELLRNDLRSADPARVSGSPSELVVQTADGEVTWMRQGRELVRSVEGGSTYVLLHEVRDFGWRRLPGSRAVEVRVRFHVSSPYLRQLAGSLPRADPGEDQDLHVLMVARGGGGTDEW